MINFVAALGMAEFYAERNGCNPVYSPLLSFIIPAHNEQGSLGATLRAIHASARMAGRPYEIIVVNDASTDSTEDVARENEALVLTVSHRQIAATRNSGARAARGSHLCFVDADTIINSDALVGALRHLDGGAAGGGAPAYFDKDAPVYAQVLVLVLGLGMRVAGICGGAFMFCTREAFHATGGFDERLFGAEDAAMSWALKRQGRFVVLWKCVVTSGRRLRGICRGMRMLATLFGIAFFPGILKRRSQVEKVWYESNRVDGSDADSLLTRTFNGLMLLLIIALLPVWALVPWSLTPSDTTLGKIRWGVAIFSCHVGLVAWP